MEFTFQKGGENSDDNFKSSGTPTSSIYGKVLKEIQDAG
jgi:hypothetical protein